MKGYGKELILDLHDCDPKQFTRESIGWFFTELCNRIDMEAEDRHFWDDLDVPEEERETEPHLKGTSAIQFIRTSNITIHTLDILRTVYLNVFSCKNFSAPDVVSFAERWFSGRVVQQVECDRL